MPRNLDAISKINLQSQKLSKLVHQKIIQEIPAFKEFDTEQLSRRIRQYIFCEYSKDIHYLMSQSLEEASLNTMALKFNAINVEAKKQGQFNLSVSFLWKIKLLHSYIFTNLYLLILILLQSFKKINQRRITWVINPMLREFSGGRDIYKRFYDFCFQGELDFLKNADLIICWSEKRDELSSEKIIFSNNIYKAMIQNLRIDFKDVLFFISSFLSDVVFFIYYLFRFDAFTFLTNDLKKLPFMRLANRKGLENIVLNTSCIYSQELWLHGLRDKNFTDHFIWWGMSTSELKLKNTDNIEYAATELFQSDKNYFWNEFHKNEAETVLGKIGESIISGPNLFYLPEDRPPTSDEYIIVFLNNPRTVPEMESYMGKGFYYYGRFEVQQAFYTTVLSEIEAFNRETGRNIKVKVKLKRAYGPKVFDERFGVLVEEIEKNGQLLSFDENLHDCINYSKAVLCTPVSTPVFLGIHKGIPSCFYDPEGVIDSDPYLGTGVTWCESPDQLRKFLTDAMG